MPVYLTCLHCGRPLSSGRRRTCSKLCKIAVAKAARRERAEENRRWEQAPPRRPTYDLTDTQCHLIESAVSSAEAHVFDGLALGGHGLKDAHAETASANSNGVYDPWASKGAYIDTRETRRKDRSRHGGIPLGNDMENSCAPARIALRAVQDQLHAAHYGDGLYSPDFHLKTFVFEVDQAHAEFLEWSDDEYDCQMRSDLR